MGELTWYSRLTVWVGAVILLAESVFGRTLGLVTVVGVLALAGGVLAFVSGLALDNRPLHLRLYSEPEMEEPPAPVLKQEAPTPEPAPAAVCAPGNVPDGSTRVTVASASDGHRGAVGIELAAENPLVGTACIACLAPLRPADVAAQCETCGSVHHASCWVSNRWHCARDGCGGHGPLEAPPAAEESPGPSTA